MHRYALIAILVASCMPSERSVRAPLDADLEKRGVTLHADVSALLAKPLDEVSVVEIALANSSRMHAALDELGIARGDYGAALGLGPVDAELLVRWGTANSAGPGLRAYEFELNVIQNLDSLITLPRLRAAGRSDITAARAKIEATALRLVARVEIAFHDLIASQQELELRRTAFDAADAAALVRERMREAGNTTDLAQARDRDAREQARIDVGRAEAAVEAAREQLNGLLGLSGDQTKWTTAGALADLPGAPPSLDDLESASVTASLDLAAGTARVASATNRAAAESTRAWLPNFGAGVSVVEHGSGIEVGPAFRVGIPLFDQRRGPRARARAEVSRSEDELTAVAVELRASARAARIRALAAYDEARHLRDVVLPLRQQIVDQTLLHYNAMDANPFELIVARRELADAGHQYLDALRRYWNATSEITALRRGVALDLPGGS